MDPPGTGYPTQPLFPPNLRELSSTRSWGKVFDPTHRQPKHAVTVKHLADLNSCGLRTQSPALERRSWSASLYCIIEALERWDTEVSAIGRFRNLRFLKFTWLGNGLNKQDCHLTQFRRKTMGGSLGQNWVCLCLTAG